MRPSVAGHTSRKAALVLVMVSGLLAAYVSGKPAAPPSVAGAWAYPNGDLANSKES